MAELKEYKCPCCGGALAFDSNLQKIKCPYCDTEFEMEALKAQELSADAYAPDEMDWDMSGKDDWEDDGMHVYVCKSCGGEIVADENTAATACPYCGNPVTMTGRLSGALKPDLVIPFKLDKAAAKEALKKHYTGKRLLPDVFTDRNHIDEIKGIYVPFWLFDAESDADIEYDATKTRHWSDSRYNYTEISHYQALRSGYAVFENIPVDGSQKMADDLMESIEPFDMKDGVDFQSAYLAGFFADKYDVSSEESIVRADRRMKKSMEDAFISSVQGYGSVRVKSSSVRVSKSTCKYALLPVWLLNTSFEGKKYTFAMNGQTGKLVGDLPIDRKKYKKRRALVFAICEAVALLAAYFLIFA